MVPTRRRWIGIATSNNRLNFRMTGDRGRTKDSRSLVFKEAGLMCSVGALDAVDERTISARLMSIAEEGEPEERVIIDDKRSLTMKVSRVLSKAHPLILFPKYLVTYCYAGCVAEPCDRKHIRTE